MRFPFCIPFGCGSGIDILEKRQYNLHEVPQDVSRSVHTLEEIYLDGNQIKTIPDMAKKRSKEVLQAVFRCHKLRILSLGQNRIQRLPSMVRSLSALQELTIDDNELTDIPSEIAECNNLRVLDIRLNPLSRFPDNVLKIISLTHLNLFETSLTYLPPDIDLLVNLRSLDVRENQLRTLPASIGSLRNLHQLDIGHNEISFLVGILPFELGSLENLEEFYADNNFLTSLPESFIRCYSLRAIDLSHNEIISLPNELGCLEKLSELIVSENSITTLPNSIGKLKNLTILKAEMNNLTEITPALSSCSSLVELYLSFNNIEANFPLLSLIFISFIIINYFLLFLPSCIGNLHSLNVLYMDRNSLNEIPSTIGCLSKLSILTLRANRIHDLPLEIGRLTNLRVLDICDNCLPYLPFTMTVLFNLRALWLSIDQVTPLIPLETAQDPATRVKVLTCYLLPQGKCQEMLLKHKHVNRSGVVNFKDDIGESEIRESVFQRRGTPHPKSRNRSGISRRHSIDGRFIRHVEDSSQESDKNAESLRRKSVGDNPSCESANKVDLKHKNMRLLQELSKQPLFLEKQKQSANAELSTTVLNIKLKRDPVIGFGLSIARGRGAEPYKEGDSGLFISHIVENSPSASANLQVGDKLILVNGEAVANKFQHVVAEMMQSKDPLELVVQRGCTVESFDSLLDSPVLRHKEISTVEIVAASLRKGFDGSFGITIDSADEPPDSEHIVISSFDNSSAHTNGSIKINGHVLNNKSLEFARSLIYDETITDLFLVLERPSFSFRSKQSLNSMESKICEKSSTSGVDSDEFSVAPTKTNAADFHSNMNQFFHENNLVREAKKIMPLNLQAPAIKRTNRPPVPPKPKNAITFPNTLSKQSKNSEQADSREPNRILNFSDSAEIQLPDDDKVNEDENCGVLNNQKYGINSLAQIKIASSASSSDINSLGAKANSSSLLGKLCFQL
ncbi:unnamed protein product [Dracunculus medinensis]|uniref:PDZ domain-containing protein n=1 Tax=Dracunculus medinensis TaxID=318479 RepID=A0A158Q4Q7_DRAME|nr:unnamed protein product [Dracunculus medinensis]